MSFTFHKCSNGNYALFCTYNAAFIEDLKSSLEWWQRYWNPEEKVWVIHREAFRKAAEICMRYGQVKFVDQDIDEPERKRQAEAKAERERQERERSERRAQEQARQDHDRYQRQQRERREQNGWRDNRRHNTTTAQSSGASDPYRVLHLQSDAPLEVVRAAYRALAVLHHPDRGGDEEVMKQLNIAHDLILRQRGER